MVWLHKSDNTIEYFNYDNINNIILFTYGGQTFAYNSTANTWEQKLEANNPCSEFGPSYSFDQKYGKFIYYNNYYPWLFICFSISYKKKQ